MSYVCVNGITQCTDEMLPLDPKSSSITDDDDRGDCIEEEDDYPEENAEAYTLVCRRLDWKKTFISLSLIIFKS